MNSLKRALSGKSLHRKHSSKKDKNVVKHEHGHGHAAVAGSAAAATSPSLTQAAIVPEGVAIAPVAVSPTSHVTRPAAYIPEAITSVEVPAQLDAQTISAEPTVVETIVKPEVVHLTSKTIEEEIIQPVVERDTEETRIHQIIQPVLDKVVNSTTYSEQVSVAENRVFREEMSPEIRALYEQNAAVNHTESAAPTERRSVVQAATVKERIHSRVIEEIQPLIEREVINPHVISRVVPIFEKVVHAPTITSEIRAPILVSELSTLGAAVNKINGGHRSPLTGADLAAEKASRLAGAVPATSVLREE